MPEAYIVEAVRTPVGKKNGGLSTAHPAEFPEAVAQAIGVPPPEPAALSGLKKLPERAQTLANDAALIKRFIFSRLAS